MNTVFLVKNSSYRFLTPPAAALNEDWLKNILGSSKLKIKWINKNICIIHPKIISHKKYKVTIDKKLTTTVPEAFIIAQNINDKIVPLNEKQEDYILDTINIKTYK